MPIRSALAGFLLLAACGGDDGVNVGGLTCGTAPCGGDPVGAWTIEATCVQGGLAPPEECPEARPRVAADLGGTVTINADMSYAIEATLSGFVSVTIPASCLAAFPITDCAQISDDVTCTGDISVECDCQQTISDAVTEAGIWSTSGNQITLDGGLDGITTNDYCVSGDAASLSMIGAEGLSLEILMTR